MTLSWSKYFSRWLLAVVVWHSGPWRTIDLSGGVTTTSCVQGDAQVSVTCCAGQWFHVSIKYYNGCYNTTNPSDMLQVNSSVSCFGGQTGTEMPSTSCSEGSGLQTCKESVTIPVNYKGNNISMVMETDCIKESDNHNVCGALSDTVTGRLYLASPSLFIARVPSARTECRCEVHANSFLQMEILFADVSVSRFTISCGQWNISEDSFSTNVTNWKVPIPQNSSDCVLEVDERFNENTSYPVHKVWININGSSLTFRCNNDTSSSSLTITNTETSKADDSRWSSTSSSSSSSQTTAATTFFLVTSSNQTRSLPTQQDIIPMSTLTTSQTDKNAPSLQATAAPSVVPDTLSSQTSSLQTRHDTVTTSSGTTAPAYNSYTSHQAEIKDLSPAYLLRVIYIVVGVAGGILLIIIFIVVVVLRRQKHRTTKYTSKTGGSSDEKLTEVPGETGFIKYGGVDDEENIQHPRSSHSVDNRRTVLEKQPATGIQGLDDKQGILIENVASQSVVDALATLHDDVTGRKHKKSEPHGGLNKLSDFMNQSTSVKKKLKDRKDASDDNGMMMFDKPYDGFSKLPETTIKSKSVKKKLEDRDDASDDDGMVMFDNVAYESFVSVAAENTSDRTSTELDSSETDPAVPKPESKLRTMNSDAKHHLPLPAGNDVWTKTQEDKGDDEDDVVEMIVNDTYVSFGS